MNQIYRLPSLDRRICCWFFYPSSIHCTRSNTRIDNDKSNSLASFLHRRRRCCRRHRQEEEENFEHGKVFARLSDSQHVMPTHTRSSITKRVSNHILNNIFPFCRVSKSFGLSLNFCKIVPDLTTMLSKAIVRAASDKGNFL